MDELVLDEIDSLEGEEGLEAGVVVEYPVPDIDVKVSRDQYSLFEINRMVTETEDLNVAPDFQRNQVWNLKQKRELIETILMGIPLPVIYLFENEKGTKQLVDGRQRVCAITGFMAGDFCLQDLKLIPRFNGKNFGNLEPRYRSKLERYQLTVYVIEPPTPERVKYDIFDRVNRGGTKLNNQEIRNALYCGQATEFLQKLAESEVFLNATGYGINAKRMKDQYVILRFLSFYLLNTKKIDFTYKGDPDEFLAHVMKFLNDCSREMLAEIQEVFFRSMIGSFNVLGPDGFRFFPRDENGDRRPINMALFESLAYLFAILNFDRIDKMTLTDKINALKCDFDESGNFKGSVDSTKSVEYRFSKVVELGRKIESA
ncbi:MAG: DUF262 domain-containing protein [Synergistota bacterium]|nr:DUF262 domain-containing protein [Synergistota bacterium]